MEASSFKKVTLTVGCMTFAFGLTIPVILYQEVFLHRKLLRSGVPAKAVVVDRWEKTRYSGKYSLRQTHYYVELNYKSGEETISRTRIVDRQDYDSAVFPVRFDPDEPHTFVFVDNPTTMADMPLGLILGCFFIAVGILCIGWVLFPSQTAILMDWLKNDAILYKD